MIADVAHKMVLINNNILYIYISIMNLNIPSC